MFFPQWGEWSLLGQVWEGGENMQKTPHALSSFYKNTGIREHRFLSQSVSSGGKGEGRAGCGRRKGY
jgi:hypothetical protein